MAKKKFWETSIANHLLQFIFIFSSVYFAFWLTERNEHRKLKDLEKQAVAGIYKELKSNLEGLKQSIPYHNSLLISLKSYQDSLMRTPVAVRLSKPPFNHLMTVFSRKDNSLGVTQLKYSAWEFLENSEAFVLLDYHVASRLASTYQTQAEGVQQTTQLIFREIFSSKDLFRPEETITMLGLTIIAITELHGQELFLKQQIETMIELMDEYYDFEDSQKMD